MALHSLLSLPFLFASSGVLLAYYCYQINLNLPKFIFSRTQGIYRILENKYGFDTFNEKFFAFGSRFLGEKFWQIGDVKIIDGWLVNGTAKSIETIFDGNSLKFIAPVDMYDPTDTYDKYLVFPKSNILV
jgi:NADH-quinone oxidoreductase subunit L